MIGNVSANQLAFGTVVVVKQIASEMIENAQNKAEIDQAIADLRGDGKDERILTIRGGSQLYSLYLQDFTKKQTAEAGGLKSEEGLAELTREKLIDFVG